MNIESISSILKMSGAPAEKEKAIKKCESYFMVTFPETLKKIYMLGSEAHLGPIRTSVDESLHFDLHPLEKGHYKGVSVKIKDSYKELKESNYFRPEVIPIGRTGDGDEVCLDYVQSGEEPRILYWYLDRAWGDADPFELIASTFDDLLIGK